MRAPAFWWREKASVAALGLWPLSVLYSTVVRMRLRRQGRRAAIPVICIGNFVLGGAGKTPMALAVAGLLREMDLSPAFLSRGYGGKEKGPLRVDPLRHSARNVGDEPLLLAEAAPTVVSVDRYAGAILCADLGAEIVVMDDGLQNPSLAKDVTFCVVDGVRGLGNRFCCPSGPLRARLWVQWPLADALVVIGAGEAGDRAAVDAARAGKPCFRAQLVPSAADAARLQGAKVIAFAGIGNPEKFFATLHACGASLVKSYAFDDHKPYSGPELRAILNEGDALGCMVVTTAKDHVRVRAALPDSLAGRIATLPVRLEFSERADIAAFIWQRLHR